MTAGRHPLRMPPTIPPLPPGSTASSPLKFTSRQGLDVAMRATNVSVARRLHPIKASWAEIPVGENPTSDLSARTHAKPT